MTNREQWQCIGWAFLTYTLIAFVLPMMLLWPMILSAILFSVMAVYAAFRGICCLWRWLTSGAAD